MLISFSFFPFEIFWCTECKFVFVLRTFFFKHKLHAGQILNFSQYLLKRPEINRNDSKFFQSEIRTPWTKFLDSPLSLSLSLSNIRFYDYWWCSSRYLFHSFEKAIWILKVTTYSARDYRYLTIHKRQSCFKFTTCEGHIWVMFCVIKRKKFLSKLVRR